MKFKIRLEGTRPMLIQSDRMADPMNKEAQEKRRMAKAKDKNTDAVQLEIGRIEWFGSLYTDEDGKPRAAIPSDNIIRAIRDAAAEEKGGKEVYKQIMVAYDADQVEPLIPIEHDGPKDVAKLYGDGMTSPYVFRKTVKQGQNRVVRVRPRFPVWAIEFHAIIGGTETIRAEDLRRYLDRAGTVGLGTWRPRYGHFRVAKFDAVKN